MNNQKRKIVFCVTNILNYDQRMNRIASALHENGYDITLVGWKYSDTEPLVEKTFNQKRLKMFFKNGKLRYIEYNIKLLWFLILNKFDLYGAIDLDTIVPCYWGARIHNSKIIYDAHEYFTELEEVVRRPFVKRIWQWVEKTHVPLIPDGYTVCQSYTNLFHEKYNVNYTIIRNATILKPLVNTIPTEKYILYQGAVNEGRALFQVVDAMQFVNCKLIICGEGNLFSDLKNYVNQVSWSHKIEMKGYVFPIELIKYTTGAYIGLTLFENKGLSNYYSLANRYFDYMHSAIPQICIDFPEYNAINKEFELAKLIADTKPETIANAINSLLDNESDYLKLKEQAKLAREVYCWQNETKKLVKFYEDIFNR